jgi:hypothetical protein
MIVNKKKVLSTLLAAAASGAFLMLTPSAALGQRPIPVADAQSRKMAAAADAFLAALSPDQRTAVLFPWGDSAQRAKWSNFPSDFFMRSGVRWGEMDASQRTAMMNLLGAVLSPKGVKMIQEQMAADDITRDTAPMTVAGRAPPSARPGAPVAHFGSDYFFVSFVGAPSTTAPWMLQVSAHHLALNATVVGPHVTLSPTLNGGEPLHFTARDGKPVYIVEDEATKARALLNSLTPEQRARAVMSDKLIQLVLGPGHDGQTLQPEGLPGRAMTAAQRTRFLAVIEARLGILNADDLAEAMIPVRKTINETYFAWYGPTEPVGAGYFRVTGPTAIIEFSPQENDLRFPQPTEHDHNMYRDPTNEYGAAWAPLK